MKKNKNKVHLMGAVAIGIGGMVGGGIFAVLGEAVSLAHGATVMAFLVAGTLAILTAYAYSKLSVAYPSRGGTVVFIDKGFNIDLLTGTLNFSLWLSYLVTISLYATAFASYAKTFFPHQGPYLEHGLISVAILIPVLLNLFNSELISKSEALIVTIKLCLLVLVICSSWPYVEPERLAFKNWVPVSSFVPAGMLIFVAYEGFELISNSAQDIVNPNKNLPRAYYISVITVIILYVLIAIVTVGAVPEDIIATSKDYVLAEAAKPSMGQFGFHLVAISAILATLSAINATVYGNARLGYILAQNKELPKALEKKVWNQPSGVLVIGVLTLVMANTLNLDQIAIISSAGFLLIFAVVNFAAYKLAATIKANKFIPLTGGILCSLALFSLLKKSFETNISALIVFLGFMLCSFLFELIFAVKNKRSPNYYKLDR